MTRLLRTFKSQTILGMIIIGMCWCIFLICGWRCYILRESSSETALDWYRFVYLGIPIFIFSTIGAIYATIRLWRKYRKKGVSFSEIPAQICTPSEPIDYMPFVPFSESKIREYQTPLQEVECPYCSNIFQISLRRKPFKVRCPKCNKESMLR